MCPHLFGRNISNWTEKSFAFNVAAVHSRPKYAYRPQTRARRAFVDILWPRIQEYLHIWEETKAENYWVAGEAMMGAIRAARVAPPTNWPPVPNAKPKRPGAVDELDDDIPF